LRRSSARPVALILALAILHDISSSHWNCCSSIRRWSTRLPDRYPGSSSRRSGNGSAWSPCQGWQTIIPTQ
jgi:hypothetical protein